jgi:hypothetical protein
MMSLSKFANEVLSRGPTALLPQNLSPQWLSEIQLMADDFLDTNFQSGSCADVGDRVDPILSACVSELLNRQHEGAADISSQEFIKKTTLYAIQITIETVRRQSNINVAQPSLDDIFDTERMSELQVLFPALAQFFDRVCLTEGQMR